MGNNSLSKALAKVAQETGINKKTVNTVVDSFLGEICESLKNGESFEIRDFGTFSIKEWAERKGRNLITNEPMVIPAKKKPAFKASSKILLYGQIHKS